MNDERQADELPDETDFRLRARAFLAENALRHDSDEVKSETRHRYHPEIMARGFAFHRKVWEAGFAGITVPTEYGGKGLPGRYEAIWREEAGPYELPPHGSGAALGIVLPLLLAHGTEEQKREHIPKILRAEVSWAQFLSEPAAGSDMAGVRTTAIRDGDEFVINGAKVWSSGAHFSQYALCLARTNLDVPKHRGLTMFVVPIPTPGLQMRPTLQITGGSEFNEEFLDDVRVPVDSVIGDINDGWRVSLAMLGFERRMLGSGTMSGGAAGATPPSELIELVRKAGRVGDPIIRQLVADVWIQTAVTADTSAFLRAAIHAGTASPHIGSALKLFSENVSVVKARAVMSIAGAGGVAWSDDESDAGRWATMFLHARASTLGGGTTEIQRNIVGERVLGLPREPQVDRDMPFRDIPFSSKSTSRIAP